MLILILGIPLLLTLVNTRNIPQQLRANRLGSETSQQRSAAANGQAVNPRLLFVLLLICNFIHFFLSPCSLSNLPCHLLTSHMILLTLKLLP